ncbi:MAG: hypothetical protein U9R48_02485 [Chloroflexota bacterium]|nr:hypothetical protein [Chloroflexota bacterium]
MEKKFRALRVVALIYKIVAWIVLVVGGLSAVFAVILGAVQERVGFQSPLLAGVPGLSQVRGLLPGLAAGLVVLLFTAIQFVLLYAVSELVHLLLALEHNTRETAFYLRGENALSSSAPDVSWDTPAETSVEES